jgi:AraC-like DNA-binding protein
MAVGVLLDSDAVAVADRPAALEAIFGANEVPQRVGYVQAARDIQHRLSLFRYGPQVHLLRNVGTGLTIERTDRHVRQGAPDQLAVFMQRRGVGYLDRGGARVTYRPGELGLMDTSRPYRWRNSERIDHFVLLVDRPEFDLTTEQLRVAAERLPASPLYELARSHLDVLCNLPADDLAPEAMDALGCGIVDILRALVVTAVGGSRAAEALAPTLQMRMIAYVDAHLHDPGLSPRQIAAAHFISLRHLYTVWARETDQSPNRWILGRRLARAHALLAHPGQGANSISIVARQCGFASISHFSHCFRRAYGISPREWATQRRQH